MATCGLLGQAVGSAAAIASKNRISPHDVYLKRISELQHVLMDADCFLPHFKRKISALCKSSALLGGDGSLRSGEDRANRIYGSESCGVLIRNGASVEYKLSEAARIGAVHIVFDSDLDRDTLPGDKCERGHVTRANVLLTSPQMYMPKTLCKSFRLTAETADGELELLCTDKNIKRSYHVSVDAEVTGLRLLILDNWGDTPETNLVSFDFN